MGGGGGGGQCAGFKTLCHLTQTESHHPLSCMKRLPRNNVPSRIGGWSARYGALCAGCGFTAGFRAHTSRESRDGASETKGCRVDPFAKGEIAKDGSVGGSLVEGGVARRVDERHLGLHTHTERPPRESQRWRGRGAPLCLAEQSCCVLAL